MAAWLGHEPAQVALGRKVERPREALRRCGHEPGVRLMLAAARVTLARWEDGEAREKLAGALAAVEAWLACPCPEHAAPCGAAEEAVDTLTAGLFDFNLDAPDVDERLLTMERRFPILRVVGAAAFAVRAPVEEVSELVGEVLDDAVTAEMHAARADRPADPSSEAARRMLEPHMGGGHGGRGPRGEPRDAVDDEVERWAAAMARFEAACRARVLSEVQAAALPWLLGAR
ncbi:MAG: hypothetical protein KIT58_15630 [Planctomycetota bacterium]|nr:hypothetical protein [Planctomycetota bacterium]